MIQCVCCASDDVDIPAPLLLEYLGEDSSLWSEIRNLMEHEIIVLRQSVEEEEEAAEGRATHFQEKTGYIRGVRTDHMGFGVVLIFSK